MKEKYGLVVEGGVGDHILATPMIRSFRNKHSNAEIGVISTHSRVFQNNPRADLFYDASEPMDFWHRFVRGNEENCFRPNIYEKNRMNQKKAMRKAICECYNIEDDNGPLELFTTPQEDGAVDQFLSQFKLPVVVLHGCGGRVRFANTKRTHNKDYPIDYMVEIIKNLMQRFQFVQMGIDGEPKIEGIPLFWNTTIGEAFALAKKCYTFIAIDSFFAHAAAAFNKKGIVLWGSTSVKAYGHDIHENITGYEGCQDKEFYAIKSDTYGCGRPDGVFFDIVPGSYLSAENTPNKRMGQLWQCPHISCMKSITPDKVINALMDLSKEIDRKEIENELKSKLPKPKTKKINRRKKINKRKEIKEEYNAINAN